MHVHVMLHVNVLEFLQMSALFPFFAIISFRLILIKLVFAYLSKVPFMGLSFREGYVGLFLDSSEQCNNWLN